MRRCVAAPMRRPLAATALPPAAAVARRCNSEFIYEEQIERSRKLQAQIDKWKKRARYQWSLFDNHPWAFRALMAGAVGGIVWYDYKYTFHGVLPVFNPITHLQYNMRVGSEATTPRGDGSGAAGGSDTVTTAMIEGSAAAAGLTPAQLAELSRSDVAERRGHIDVGASSAPVGKVHVLQGHMDRRQSFWDLRNNERNWSIMCQDRQRQVDSYEYRKERSRDDDYGRQSFPK